MVVALNGVQTEVEKMRTVKLSAALFALGAMFAQGASAQSALMSFTFSELNGSFDANSSLFNAADDWNTNGDVTRLVAPIATTFFQGNAIASGFPGTAAFSLSMSVSNLTSSTADGVGTIVLTDSQGDTFTSNVSGTWSKVGSAGSFSGILTNVMPSNSGDGTFDGTDGSSINMIFPATPPFSGNIITLAFQNWFTDSLGAPLSFQSSTTLASGAIVPEPATLALLALGGLVAAARRRR